MIWNYLQLLREIGWGDLLDIGLATVLLGVGIHALRSSRARTVSLGLFFFAGIFFIANRLELKLTSWLLQGLAAVTVLIVVVVYQAEIRRFLEQFPNQFLLRKKQQEVQTGVTELLVETLRQLGFKGWGALIILPGRDALDGLLSGGIALDGKLSKPLLLSIFDPNSPGHDGALVVRGERIERFGLRLPLSDQHEQLRDRGTRHAAALGLAERSDALVLVVSEETSQISLAEHGVLHPLEDLDQLAQQLNSFLQQPTGDNSDSKPLGRLLGGYGFDSLVALFIALLLWLVLVPGAVVEERTVEVPVRVQNIPEGFSLKQVTPETVTVILAGERRELFLLKERELEIQLDGTLTRFGRKTFSISKTHLLLPAAVDTVRIVPEQVLVLVEELN